MATRPVETIKKQRLDFTDRRLPFEWRSGSGNPDRNAREIRFPFTRPQIVVTRRSEHWHSALRGMLPSVAGQLPQRRGHGTAHHQLDIMKRPAGTLVL